MTRIRTFNSDFENKLERTTLHGGRMLMIWARPNEMPLNESQLTHPPKQNPFHTSHPPPPPSKHLSVQITSFIPLRKSTQPTAIASYPLNMLPTSSSFTPFHPLLPSYPLLSHSYSYSLHHHPSVHPFPLPLTRACAAA